MHCLSCSKPVTSKEARLWERKILVCPGCAELADKAKRELDAALHRAEEQALMYLEQQIMSGALVDNWMRLQVPGLGDTGA